MPIFTVDERTKLRSALIEKASGGPRITGCALVGSASLGREDELSDIDLGFGVRSQEEVEKVKQDFSGWLYSNEQVVKHLDLPAGGWIFRVFFLENTLQVDLSFVVHMINGLRDHVLTLACLRHGFETSHGRGFHLLPEQETKALEGSLVCKLEKKELWKSYNCAIGELAREVERTDGTLAKRLTPLLETLSKRLLISG